MMSYVVCFWKSDCDVFNQANDCFDSVFDKVVAIVCGFKISKPEFPIIIINNECHGFHI